MRKRIKATKCKEPWEKTKAEIFGSKTPAIDAWAANWNEEAFCLDPCSPKKTTCISRGFFKTFNTYNSILGRMEEVIARDEYGVAKDKEPSWGNSIRYLLMNRVVTWDGKYLYGEWGPVGEYAGGNLGILLSHRGKGVGFTFVRWLIQHNILKPSVGYSPVGYRIIEKAHRSIVEQAMKEGKTVPELVLVDYPEFMCKDEAYA